MDTGIALAIFVSLLIVQWNTTRTKQSLEDIENLLQEKEYKKKGDEEK